MSPDDPNLSRWQGEVDAFRRQQERHNEKATDDLTAIRAMVGEIRVELARVTTKVGLFAAGASLLGGGAVALVVKLSSGG